MNAGPLKSALLEVSRLRVVRAGVLILDIPQFQVNSGEVVGVIGPNGAGKTTFMTALSGLMEPQAGQFLFRGAPVRPFHDLSYRRKLAIVMQSPLLLNSSVYDNVTAGLRFRGIPGQVIRARANEWLERLGIAHLSRRPARALSGGEAQRVSLARAFVLQPELILLDEPFSALDAPTRALLVSDLKGLLSKTGTAGIFITHDLDEALGLSDRIAVFIRGELRQMGSPREIFSRPVDPDVARFTGVEMVLPAQVVHQSEGLIRADCGGLTLEAVSGAAAGSQVYLCLRPEDLILSTHSPQAQDSARNHFSAVIEQISPQGPFTRIGLKNQVRLVSLVTRSSCQEMGLAPGQPVYASVKATAIHVIEKST